MDSRRLQILVDCSCPLDRVDREVGAFQAWASQWDHAPLAPELVLFGRTASWVPEGVPLARSTLRTSLAGGPANLAAALRLVKARPAHALALLLASEPAPGWEEAAGSMPAFRSAFALGGSRVPPSLGQGHFGAVFRGEHLALGLRWLLCELRDRTWLCGCGDLRILGDRRACASCGSTEVPRRLEVGGRIVLLAPRATLFPHHLGRTLAFDAVPTIVDGRGLPDGGTRVGGVECTVSSGPLRVPDDLAVEASVRAEATRCHACGGPLREPILHRPPDPRRFCVSCTSAPFRCDFCDTPVGAQGGNLWPDGRSACRECWTTSLTSIDEAHALAESGRSWISRKLGMEVPSCPTRLEHAATIAALNGRVFLPQPGFNARPIGFFAPPQAGGPAICLEHGTPRSVAYGVLVHELTHFWQSRNWPREVDRTLVEGLAMWVEYQALLAAGAIHAARNSELYGDPVYGLGFRLALAVEERLGAEFVKTRLHEITAWPVA